MDAFTLYTVDEITEILHISKKTLYKFIKSGVIKAVKIGKYWRIKQSDFIELVEKGTAKPSAEAHGTDA
ncbi:MAG: hypothetical protein A2Y16_04955 [Tenericutes bacterium GWF2_57_13]|nr:MAG: hypothetical protein A2Y16_04955 [Tenericutes bacterium GWF2_57_13]